ncbi:MAG: FixH family protein [Candidatus Electryonea clarkiae]|nr:FixH family protein [Candidatus Electryonea clarkiae]MDP8287746.1 FixH family protein [Candidatus Electryonea clarkiae]
MEDVKKRNFEYYIWPWGLVAAIVLFVIVLIISVFSSTMNRNDLVTKHYYSQGLEYQVKKDMMERSQLPENTVTIKYSSRERKIDFIFPEGIDPAEVKGTIKFFRPSQARLDREFNIQLDPSGLQSISTTNLRKGYWRIQINWNTDSQDFYIEKTVIM